MVKKKVCNKCYRTIKEGERYVLLGTYEDETQNKTRTIEEIYRHLECWKEYMKETIDDKIEGIRKNLMTSAGALAGNLMRNMRGMQQ